MKPDISTSRGPPTSCERKTTSSLSKCALHRPLQLPRRSIAHFDTMRFHRSQSSGRGGRRASSAPPAPSKASRRAVHYFKASASPASAGRASTEEWVSQREPSFPSAFFLMTPGLWRMPPSERHFFFTEKNGFFSLQWLLSWRFCQERLRTGRLQAVFSK
jgi:hypothetical protein